MILLRKGISTKCKTFGVFNYSRLSQMHMEYFKSFLSPSQILIKSEDNTNEFKKYTEDWFGVYKGSSPLVLKPNNVKDVQRIMFYCNEESIAVVPQGGNTGLGGGGIPFGEEIVLSMVNLNKIIKFDSQSKILTCESGCVLQSLNDYIRESNCEIPLDLASVGSCQIGGNVSTNAGGKYMIKYGPLRGKILNLKENLF